MGLSLFAIAGLGAGAQTTAIAQWTYAYTHSDNAEHDVLYREGETLHYVQTGQGLHFERTMPVDNIRHVGVWESHDEIDVQIWAPFNTSALILHFNVAQRDLAQDVARRVEDLRY